MLARWIGCLSRLRTAMEQAGRPALLTFRLEHLRYVSPYRPPASSSITHRVAALVTQDALVVFIPQIDVAGLTEVAAGQFEVSGLPINPAAWPATLQPVLDRLVPKGATIAVDAAPASVMPHLTGDFVFDSGPWETARRIKTVEEVDSIRRGLEMTTAAIQAALDTAKPGVSELEVAAAAEHAARIAGAEGFAFLTICTTNGDTVRRRYASNHRFVPGDFVFTDVGILNEGYCAEYSRATIIGDRVTEDQRGIFQTAYAANRAMMAAIAPGVMASTLDQAARDVILSSPYAPYIHRHVTGSGIGVLLQEAPIISDPFDGGIDTPIEAGMVLNIEPGVYHLEIGGLRAEDLVLVTETGYELLTPYPYDERLL